MAQVADQQLQPWQVELLAKHGERQAEKYPCSDESLMREYLYPLAQEMAQIFGLDNGCWMLFNGQREARGWHKRHVADEPYLDIQRGELFLFLPEGTLTTEFSKYGYVALHTFLVSEFSRFFRVGYGDMENQFPFPYSC